MAGRGPARPPDRGARRAGGPPRPRRHPHLGGRPDRLGQDDHVPRPGPGARRQHPRARAPAQPGRPDGRRARAALPVDPHPPGGARVRRAPRRQHLHLPGGAAASGADGLGLGHPPDLRRGARHPGRADAAPAGPGDQRGRRGLHRHGRHHHRARGAGLRPGRGHPRPPLRDRARHPLPAALAARRAGGGPLRRGQGARRLRPGQPGTRPRPGPLAPGLRRGVGGALPAAVDGGRRLHRHRGPGPRARRRDDRARGARRRRLGPDPGPGAAAGAVRLRLRAHRRALQRRPPHRGLGRDPRLGGDAPRADHLRARLRAAAGTRDAPRARQGGGLGRVPPGGRPDGRADEPRGLRARVVQAARPRRGAAGERRAQQAGEGRRAAVRARGRLGEAGQPGRRPGADRRRAWPTADGARRIPRCCRTRSWRSGSRPPPRT